MGTAGLKEKIIHGLRLMESALGDTMPPSPVPLPEPELVADFARQMNAMVEMANKKRLFGFLFDCRDRMVTFLYRGGLRDIRAGVTTSTAAVAIETARLMVTEAPFVVAGKAGLAAGGVAILAGAAVGVGVGCGLNEVLFDGPCFGIWSSEQYQESVEADERRVVLKRMEEFGKGHSIPGREGVWYGPQPSLRNVAKK